MRTKRKVINNEIFVSTYILREKAATFSPLFAKNEKE
jgi:hypothetical protein